MPVARFLQPFIILFPFLTADTIKTLICALVLSKHSYVGSLLTGRLKNTSPLDRVQNLACCESEEL